MIVIGSIQGTYSAIPKLFQDRALSQMVLSLSTAKVILVGSQMRYVDDAYPQNQIGGWTTPVTLDSVRQAAADYAGNSVLHGEFGSQVLQGQITVPTGYASIQAWYDDFMGAGANGLQLQKWMNDAFVNVLGLPSQGVY